MPRVASLLPIPRRYEAQGVRRYGFHGLSYAFLMEELARLGDPAAATGPRDPRPSRQRREPGRRARRQEHRHQHGLHPDGRIGDEHPLGRSRSRTGLLSGAHRTDERDAISTKWSTTQSGLLGVSETSSDMRDLLDREAQDVRAAEAVALFCYQVKKWIGAFAAALGGLDTLVFAGGIGENAPPVRGADLRRAGISRHRTRPAAQCEECTA